MTLPQILLLNHASSCNHKKMEARVAGKESADKVKEDTDPVVWRGKRLSQMTSDETMLYMNEG